MEADRASLGTICSCGKKQWVNHRLVSPLRAHQCADQVFRFVGGLRIGIPTCMEVLVGIRGYVFYLLGNFSSMFLSSIFCSLS